MRTLELSLAKVIVLVLAAASMYACSAAGERKEASGTGNSGSSSSGGGTTCDICVGVNYTPCNSDGTPGAVQTCTGACVPGKGCVACTPGSHVCVGNEVHKCSDDAMNMDEVVDTCDAAAGEVCSNGFCQSGCAVADGQPSNIGCEFWAVDLDQQDGFNDPASAPWGVVLSNAGQSPAHVVIEINEAPPGQPQKLTVVSDITVDPGNLQQITLPTRELDCGVKPNDYASPGTCLSSNAFRIRASSPIVVYQFNVFENAYSNDASLLLPSNALGTLYRVINWGAGHPVKIFGIIDRSYVTVVGISPNTQVRVKPSWRIKGNPPVAATPAGGEILVTIGAFDVLNLETDDATFQDDPKTMADLSGTFVQASAPVAVFSGVETTAAPGSAVDVPTPPGWTDMDTCCLDHLEDQMFPMDSVGSKYVIPRSPVRSTSGFREPDVIRFMGVAEPSEVTTTLPSPYDKFTLQPGEVKTTYTQDNMIVSATKPVMVGQILVSNQYVDGPYIGDPSLTVFPPVDQFRTEYVFLTPSSWTQNWVVITAEVGSDVQLDGGGMSGCITEPAGMLDGKNYESRRCQVAQGVHKLTGALPFGITAYGYGSAGSYAFVGGADVKKVYEPPPIQ